MSVLLAVSGAVEIDILQHLAGAHPPIPVARRCADEAELLGAARAGLGHIAVVDDADVMLVADLHAAGVRVVAVASDEYARERGIDAVCSPYGAEVASAVASLMRAPRIEPAAFAQPLRSEGKIIAVWGTGGAPGRSVLARDLAACLARGADSSHRLPWQRGIGAGAHMPCAPRTLLIDADTANPSLAQLLALPQESSAIAALARKINREGSAGRSLAGACVECAGFDVVAGLNTGARWRELPEPIMRGICASARAGWDITLIDCASSAQVDGYSGPAERDSATLTVLDEADAVLCVAKASPVGVRRLLTLLDEAPAQHIEHLHIVLTHAPRRAYDPRREAIAQMLAEKNYEVAAWVSRDDARYEKAELTGRSLMEFAGECAAARDISALATFLASTDEAPAREAPRAQPQTGAEALVA